jgi:hypothetical protein
MRLTKDQLAAVGALRAVAGNYKTATDTEGWPIVPGRLGRLEHDGAQLAVYTDRPRLIERLLATPGVTRHQRGDAELRAWVDPAALPGVAQLIKARRRRSQTSLKSLVNLRSRATSGGQDEPGSPVAAAGPDSQEPAVRRTHGP